MKMLSKGYKQLAEDNLSTIRFMAKGNTEHHYIKKGKEMKNPLEIDPSFFGTGSHIIRSKYMNCMVRVRNIGSSCAYLLDDDLQPFAPKEMPVNIDLGDCSC